MLAGGTDGSGMLSIPGNTRLPTWSWAGTAGRGSQIAASLPRYVMRGTSGGPSPQTLFPTGC